MEGGMVKRTFEIVFGLVEGVKDAAHVGCLVGRDEEVKEVGALGLCCAVPRRLLARAIEPHDLRSCVHHCTPHHKCRERGRESAHCQDTCLSLGVDAGIQSRATAR
jgi:hypothetical protein